MKENVEILQFSPKEDIYNCCSDSDPDPEILNSIFDDIPIMIILVNQEGVIESVNKTTLIILEKERNECIGIPVGNIFGCLNSSKEDVCGKNKECSECIVYSSVMHTFETGKSVYKKEGELEIKKHSGSATLHFLISTTLIRQNDEFKVSLIIDDTSEIKQTNNLLQRKLEIEKVIESISSRFISSKDIDNSINFALEMICNLFGSARSYIFLYREDGTKMDNVYEYCPEGIDPQKDKRQGLPVNMFPWWMNRLHNGEPIHIRDTASFIEGPVPDKDILKADKIGTTVALPLYQNYELSGFIGMDNAGNVAEYGKEEIDTLLTVSHIIGTSLERKQIGDALQRSEHKFRALFNNSSDPIIIYDLDGKILEVNNIACTFTGYRHDEMLNMSIMDLDSAEYAPKVSENVKELLQKRHAMFETVALCKDGSLVPIELSNRLIEYDDKTAILSTARDLSERKKIEEALICAKLSAEESNRAKSEFLANMSHELRTPLNSIIGFSDILNSEIFGTLNEKQKQHISRVAKSGNDLLELINQVLNLSMIEAGKIQFEPELVDVHVIISEIKEPMVPLASNKEIELNYISNAEKIHIVADPMKLRTIVHNLVSNAIKFTEKGGSVTIETRTYDESIHIFVKDNGIGISSDDQKKLFRSFSQVDSSTTRKYGGTGIGLALVKKYVELHNGEVWVESEIGKGSTFGFSIPVDPESSTN